MGGSGSEVHSFINRNLMKLQLNQPKIGQRKSKARRRINLMNWTRKEWYRCRQKRVFIVGNRAKKPHLSLVTIVHYIFTR